MRWRQRRAAGGFGVEVNDSLDHSPSRGGYKPEPPGVG